MIIDVQIAMATSHRQTAPCANYHIHTKNVIICIILILSDFAKPASSGW